MNKALFEIGTIIKNVKDKKEYRIIALFEDTIILCEMGITNLYIFQFDKSVLISLLMSDEYICREDQSPVFDIDKLPYAIRNKFIERRNLMNDVLQQYGPTFLELNKKGLKPGVESLITKYNINRSTFWRTCIKFFQSGMRESSLVDQKAFGVNTGKTYRYTKKTGRPPEYFPSCGVPITPDVEKYFKEALNDYKSGRLKSIQKCFEKMTMLHFTTTEIINGAAAVVLKPQSERPTYRQLYNYISKHLTTEEKDRIKTSAMEQRNNKRLLLSDALEGVYGPGDMVEIDACEADVSLVSSIDPNRTIGRPIVYFMVDVYTRVILAVSVAFDNNSVLGVTNLFLNLADDKQEYCARYGMGFDNPEIWPSNVIPRRIRVDRGSEFKSKEFGRICNELGIEKQIVPGGSGSLKGVVEQAFHQMHSKQNVHLENYGLIEKRHDSNHHKEATLNIDQYTKMVINFVLTHNQQYFETYPMTKDMLVKRVRPIPALLWQYGIKKYGSPRPITNKEQYLYNLMTPITAKVSRKGISYKDLWYLPENDVQLSREMFNAGNKKIPFEARMDMRCIGNIYYLRNGKLVKAPLNARKTGNADFANLTMKQWEDFRKLKNQMNAEGKLYNLEVEAFNYLVNESLVNESKKKTYSDDKNMRSIREQEKQLVSFYDNIDQRLSQPEEVPQIEERVEEKPPVKEYQSWEEALQDCWDNYS